MMKRVLTLGLFTFFFAYQLRADDAFKCQTADFKNPAKYGDVANACRQSWLQIPQPEREAFDRVDRTTPRMSLEARLTKLVSACKGPTPRVCNDALSQAKASIESVHNYLNANRTSAPPTLAVPSTFSCQSADFKSFEGYSAAAKSCLDGWMKVSANLRNAFDLTYQANYPGSLTLDKKLSKLAIACKDSHTKLVCTDQLVEVKKSIDFARKFLGNIPCDATAKEVMVGAIVSFNEEEREFEIDQESKRHEFYVPVGKTVVIVSGKGSDFEGLKAKISADLKSHTRIDAVVVYEKKDEQLLVRCVRVI